MPPTEDHGQGNALFQSFRPRRAADASTAEVPHHSGPEQATDTPDQPATGPEQRTPGPEQGSVGRRGAAHPGAEAAQAATAGASEPDGAPTTRADGPGTQSREPRRRAVQGGRRARRAADQGDDDLELSTSPRRPGDLEQTRVTVWDDATIRQYRTEWYDVKAQFVDDPAAALTRARELLTGAVHELTESLLAERDDLDPARHGTAPDTEAMRMAMRGYREYLDRILSL